MKFLRIMLKGTEEACNRFNYSITESDLYDIQESEFYGGEKSYHLYFDNDSKFDEYKFSLETYLFGMDKNDFEFILLDENQNTTQYAENPLPDVMTEVYKWQ